MNQLSAWIQASRPLAHANIAPPILLGQALACAAGSSFDEAMAVLAFAFGALDHLYIVYANDYADRDADRENDAPTFLSGGSRVIVEGKLSARAVGIGGLVAALVLCALSIGAVFLGRPFFIVFALAAIALLYAYSFPPLRLAHRGLGELAQGIGVGLVLPLLGYYAQRGRIDDAPWPAFALLVALGTASNVATALPDRRADERVHKRTWAVRLGEKRARLIAIAIVVAAVAALPLMGLAPFELAIVGGPALLAAIAAALLVPTDLQYAMLIGGAIGWIHAAWAVLLFT